MADGYLKKLNEHARMTGKTRAELEDELRGALFGEPKGIAKWIDSVRKSLRRPTESDRENRRVFEETRAREAAADYAARADKALAAKLDVFHAVHGPDADPFQGVSGSFELQNAPPLPHTLNGTFTGRRSDRRMTGRSDDTKSPDKGGR